MSDIKYQNENFNFVYRVSAIIYNLDKSKILLFYGNDSDFYMLPGGKVKQLEDSKDAIKREIYEELGFTGIEFKYIGTSEEIVKNNNQFIQELTITYEGVYNKEVDFALLNFDIDIKDKYVTNAMEKIEYVVLSKNNLSINRRIFFTSNPKNE